MKAPPGGIAADTRLVTAGRAGDFAAHVVNPPV